MFSKGIIWYLIKLIWLQLSRLCLSSPFIWIWTTDNTFVHYKLSYEIYTEGVVHHFFSYLLGQYCYILGKRYIIKYLGSFFLNLRSKKVWGWITRFWHLQISDLFDFAIFFFHSFFEEIKINQNFRTVCHTEACLTYSRLRAVFSGSANKWWVQNLTTSNIL